MNLNIRTQQSQLTPTKQTGATQTRLTRLSRTMLTVTLAMGLLLMLAPPALAFEGRGGNVVTIAADEVIEDDLYVGAERLVIDGVIKGDLFFGANTVILNGTVEGDMNGGGQSVTINGTVGDDLRVGLTSLTLSEGASIQGDLMMGGFSLDAQSGSAIGGDVLLGAGQARLAGNIAKDVMAGVNALEILGAIGGDVNAEVGIAGESISFNPMSFMPDAPTIELIPGGLTVGDSAAIGGELSYSSAQSSNIPEIAEGGTTFELDASAEAATVQPTVASQVWRIVSRTIALVLLGLLFVWLFRRPIQRAASRLDTDLGSSSLWGLIVAIVTPMVLFFGVAALIMVAVLFGFAQLGLISGTVLSAGIPVLIVIGAGFFLIWGLISKVVVGYWLGQKIVSNSASIWIPVVIGVAIVAILSSLPYVGLLVSAVVAILGLGAIWLTMRDGAPQVESSPAI